jgi:hypothetical protein
MTAEHISCLVISSLLPTDHKKGDELKKNLLNLPVPAYIVLALMYSIRAEIITSKSKFCSAIFKNFFFFFLLPVLRKVSFLIGTGIPVQSLFLPPRLWWKPGSNYCVAVW